MNVSATATFYKITQEKIFEIFNCNCTDVIDITPKVWSIKEKKKVNWTSTTFKILVLQKTSVRK